MTTLPMLPMFFKLVRTATSKSFLNSLKKTWKGSDTNVNIKAIESRSKASLKRSLDHHGDQDNATFEAYLTSFQEHKGVKLTQADKSGLVKSLNISTFSQLDSLIYESYRYKVYNHLTGAQFNFHQVVRAMIEYLIIKETIENGSNNITFNGIIQTLLKNKPPEFFERGYINDLFVCDQVVLFNSPNDCLKILCRSDYLSTYMFCKEDQISDQNAEFYSETYKIA